MEAIEKIVEQLNQQAQEERLLLEEKEFARINQEVHAELEEMKAEHKKQLEKNLENLENNYKQTKNRQQMIQKQTILNQKQAILERVFSEAVTKMENWSVADQLDFAHNALEKMSLQEPFTFIPGEKSSTIFTAKWLEEQNQLLHCELVMGKAPITNQAGFILDKEGVQYNFLYQRLVREIQQREGFKIAQMIFEEER